MKTKGTIGELVAIQYLRGVAAMMVLLFHLPVQLARMGYDGPHFLALSSGVDIFYVISGVVMWVTTIDRPGDTPVAFWRRRILRVVPLYWIVTAAIVAVMLVLPAALRSSRFDAAHVVASFLFTAYPHPATGRIEPVLIPGWTLNHEMLFYLVFGLFLLAAPRVRLIGIIAVLVLLVLVGRLMAFPHDTVPGFYTSAMLLHFATGVAIGAVAVSGAGLERFARSWGWMLFMSGIATIAIATNLQHLAYRLGHLLGAGMLVAGLLIVEARGGLFRSAWLHRLGDASYSIYLSHMISLAATCQIWLALGLPISGGALWIYAPCALIVSTAAGWLLYRLVEAPLLQRLRR